MTDNVKPGDPITASAWNKMASTARQANVVFGGDNVRISKTPHGTLINAKTTIGWNHPWRVISSRDTAMINPGLINDIMPTIFTAQGLGGGAGGGGGDVKLNNQPPPKLTLSQSLFDGNGNGYIALELTFDDKWQTIKKAEIVQCVNITHPDDQTVELPQFYFGFPGLPGFKSRYPIAKLRNLPAGIAVFQVAMFNLNHKARPGVGSGSVRHFYWPV